LVKKTRSKAQKAATKKLVALNKAKAKKKAKNTRKSSKSRVSNKRKSTKSSRKSQPLRSTEKSKNMAKRRRTSKSSTSKIGNVFNRGTIGKVVAGVGAAALVGAVMNRFLPNSPITAIAKPIAAYAGGGAAGAIGSVILDGGLDSIGSFFGMQSNSTNQTASGGFTV
tara:strand:- start:1485 stop:1985 length:501 start_codon:yes stop_codon:yes gene_type:complete